MSESRALAILVYNDAGTLLRCSPEAMDLTGFPKELAASLSGWCRTIFRDSEALQTAWEAIEQVLREQVDTPGFREFSAPFQTLDGKTKLGQFTVFSTGVPGPGRRQIFLSMLDQSPFEGLGWGAMERGIPDHPEGALRQINSAVLSLLAILEDGQTRVVEASALLRNHQAGASHFWEELFREALTFERLRDQMQAIRDSVAIMERTLPSRARLSDPDVPMAAASLEGPVTLSLGLSLRKLERFWILSTLQALGGNRSQCALRLGIALRTVRTKLKEYRREGFKVPPPRKPVGRRKSPTGGVLFGASGPAGSMATSC